MLQITFNYAIFIEKELLRLKGIHDNWRSVMALDTLNPVNLRMIPVYCYKCTEKGHVGREHLYDDVTTQEKKPASNNNKNQPTSPITTVIPAITATI